MDFTKLWTAKNVNGKHGDDFSLWKPIPPKGFVCIGHIGSESHTEPPDKESIMCVPKCAAIQGTDTTTNVWSTAGTLSKDGTAGVDTTRINMSEQRYVHHADWDSHTG